MVNNPFKGTLNVKDNVVFHPETWHRPEMWALVFAVRFTAPVGYDPTITGGVEGRHSIDPWSKHYTGWALDFRIKDLAIENLDRWVRESRKKLGDKYFLLLEANHLHIHYNGG